METIFHGFNKLLHHLCFMGRMTINDKKHCPVDSVKKPLDEINELNGSQPALDRHETEFALSANGRDQVQPKPRSGAADHRGFPFNRPGGAGVMIRAHARLIAKEYESLLLTGQALDFRILFLQPSLEFLRLLLIGTPDRTLRCQTQLTQQTTNRSFAKFDPKLLVNQLPHHSCCPKRKTKLQLQRILVGHGLVNPMERFAIQFRASSSSFLGIQSSPSAMLISGQPTVYRDAVDSQCLGYNFRTLSSLHAGYSSLSQVRQRLMIKLSSIRCFHGCHYNSCRL